MPQHWAGRVRYLVAIVALAIGLAQPLYASAASSSPPKFGLPWADGTSWRLTGGPHSNVGKGRPWSSLDFNGAVRGKSYPVRAVAAGVVRRPCANWVQIVHGDGWVSSYYHLARIRVKAGQRIARGTVLGYTSTQSGCGGSASGPHVHFSIKYRGDYVNVNGLVLGGWVVREGDSQYEGCLVRDTTRKCPGASVYNFGR